jgi:NAD(P)-dependent dehydrogenase (short-subunit alcohol dehydrogenase family)
VTELRFDGRVAVVTGAGRGLGREYAMLLASRGAKVVVNDPGVAMFGDNSDAGPAQQVVDEIKAAGGEAVVNLVAVGSRQACEAVIKTALDAYGKIDILICNAGNVRRGGMDDMTEEDFRSVIDVHLYGSYFAARAAFPHMKAANFGRVVLTSSIGAIYGNQQVVNYGMAKGAMLGLNHIIGIEGAPHNIKSNIILPGAVTRMSEGIDITQFPPMGPEKVAPVVGYLAHESCAVSGEMYASVAGRVARAFIAESKGVYRPDWTIEDMAANIDAIRDASEMWRFEPVPTGFGEHLRRSFEMARGG